ncbi:hypothetical protein D6C77_07956 [Aureobasidium pullulans]|nr:hypothetical protein D6C77_07956 [Aureobasidium pullulans]
MSSLTSLPPEARSMVYDLLAPWSKPQQHRILYYGHNPLRARNLPPPTRSIQRSGLDPQDRIIFRSRSSFHGSAVKRAKRAIHLANIEDLLALTGACRLLRSEILSLAWSNADIFVKASPIYKELTCIFDNRLSAECCNFIRTLRIEIKDTQWPPSEMKKMGQLITRRLPQLQTLFVVIRSDGFRTSSDPPQKGLLALASVPLNVTIKILTYIPGDIDLMMRNNGQFSDQQLRDHRKKQDGKYEANLLVIRSKGQQRRVMQEQIKQQDVVGDLLEDTVEMRSLMFS